jgi:hypothetical protein
MKKLWMFLAVVGAVFLVQQPVFAAKTGGGKSSSSSKPSSSSSSSSSKSSSSKASAKKPASKPTPKLGERKNAHKGQGTGNFKGKKQRHQKPGPHNEKKKLNPNWIVKKSN